MSSDKRQYERHTVMLDVAFDVDGQRVEGKSRDISLGGMFVVAPKCPAYGAQLVVQVSLPALTDAASIPCTVRWVGGGGMGLQFGSLRARETWAINQLCK